MAPKRPKKKASTTAASGGTRSEKEVRNTVVLFADIIGASEISNHKTPKGYFKFVEDFQKIFRKVCRKYLEKWKPYASKKYYLISARGDEGVLMIFPPADQSVLDLGEDVDAALNIAFGLKRQWLMSQENTKGRIDAGLLPIDLGIGIHLGQTWVLEGRVAKHKHLNPLGCAPEGYAINLAKRIESHSRNGKYTNVFLSNAAHGAWTTLTDENLFFFDEQQPIQAKGISQTIHVFEVKHHFLPTDWAQGSEQSKRAKTFLDPEETDLTVLRKAQEMNPTNIWLAEEYIRGIMLKKFNDLPKADREKRASRKRVFEKAREVVDYLASGDQKDVGLLLLQGFIEGECLEFDDEREKYTQAIKDSPRYAEAYWYRALSYSYEVAYGLQFDVRKGLKDINEKQKNLVKKALEDFEKAKYLSFNSAWIPFDYGCEICRWAETPAEKDKAIREISLAARLLPDEVGEAVEEEKDDYLNKVSGDSRIQGLLPK